MLESILQRTGEKLAGSGTLSPGAIARLMQALSVNRLRSTGDLRNALREPIVDDAEAPYDEDQVANGQ